MGESKSHSFWYSPETFVNKIKEVFGTITIDPTTSPEANQRIGASIIYTIEDSCLDKDTWLDGHEGFVTCYMNPPYSRDCGTTKPFASKLIEQINKGVVDTAIVLVNSSTSATWFQELGDNATLIHLPQKRIKFDQDLDYVKKYIDSDVEGEGLETGEHPRYDNAVFLLFGEDVDKTFKHEIEGKFRKVFKGDGLICQVG